MANVQRSKLIERIISLRFPLLPLAQANLVNVGRLRNPDTDGSQTIKAAAFLSAELEALNDEDLVKAHDAAMADAAWLDAKRASAEAKRRQAEIARIDSNFPPADFVYWAKFANWKIDEAIALILGRSPATATWSNLKYHGSTLPLSAQFARIQALAARAIEWRQLHDPVAPGIFLAWAKRYELPVPAALEEQVQKFGHFIGDWKTNYDKLKARHDESEATWQALHEKAMGIIAERDASIDTLMAEVSRLRSSVTVPTAEQPRPASELGAKERDSLLKMVLGMAIAYHGFEADKERSTTVGEIASELMRVGISVSEDTIRKYLRMAADEHGDRAKPAS